MSSMAHLPHSFADARSTGKHQDAPLRQIEKFVCQRHGKHAAATFKTPSQTNLSIAVADPRELPGGSLSKPFE